MIYRWLKPIITLALVAAAIWQVALLLEVLHGGAKASEVETAAVKQGPFIVGISREGTVKSVSVTSIRAPRSGSTLTWVIDDGATVKEGDLIAKVDAKEYEFQVEQQRLQQQRALLRVDQQQRDRTRDWESAQANVDKTLRGIEVLVQSQATEGEQAEAQIGFDQWNYRWAEQDYQKQERLSEGGIVPQTTVEQSERTLRSREYGLAKSEKEAGHLESEHSSKKKQSESDVETAEFNVELAHDRIAEAIRNAKRRAKLSEERLQEMESELSESELSSPADGVVVLGKTWDETGMRALKEGDRVWRGRTVAQIADLSQLQVSLSVDEASIHQVRPGQPAVVTVKTAPGREFAGRVEAVGAVGHEIEPFEDPNAIPGQRVFEVTVELTEEKLSPLRPGLRIEVQFVTERIPQAVYVPISAVFGKSGGQVVYLRRGRSFVARRVKTGPRNDKSIVILEGLKPGDKVALSDATLRGASSTRAGTD